MKKALISSLVILILSLSIGCDINEKSSKDLEEIPITVLKEDFSANEDIKYITLDKNYTMKKKVEIIANTISEECFNGLPIKITIYANKIAKVDLMEDEELKDSKISWEEDYLNETIKEYTVRTIVENILREEYRGEWIDKVQLYYEGELISLN